MRSLPTASLRIFQRFGFSSWAGGETKGPSGRRGAGGRFFMGIWSTVWTSGDGVEACIGELGEEADVLQNRNNTTENREGGQK